METIQRWGVQSSEGLEPLGIMGNFIKDYCESPATSRHCSTEGFKDALNKGQDEDNSRKIIAAMVDEAISSWSKDMAASVDL